MKKTIIVLGITAIFIVVLLGISAIFFPDKNIDVAGKKNFLKNF